MIDSADHAVGLALGVVAVIGAIVTWVRWLRPKVRSGTGQVVAVRDSILGRDAIYDSITGKEIEPALPGIGQRMAVQESQMSEMTRAVSQLAETHAQLIKVDETLLNHEGRLQALEAAAVERVVTKVESTAAWRAMAAAAGDTESPAAPLAEPEGH